jgi:serine/threonine protein kinase
MSNPSSNQPNDPLAGLNPENLLKQGLAGSGTAPTEDRAGNNPFTPPTVEELNALLPPFEVIELLGRGGMGAVYKARQSALDRFVAIKILPPQVGRDPAFAERFSREAKALAKLSHPNIVSVHDAGSVSLTNSEDKLYYFVMEFVDGVSLRQVIRDGKFSAEESLAIVPQVCEALQYAHDEGIVHRDIKPDNILLDTRGRVKIADFGLAKLLDATAVDVTLTGTHQVMGTLRYMAPEQMTGTKSVDHRADIYSLGVVFYELLTGDVPMGRFAAPSKKVQIDVRLDEVVLRALEQEPDKRYQQASEVKTQVEAIKGQAQAAPLKPLAQMGVMEGLRELLVPEQHDQPGTPAWQRWYTPIIFLCVYVGMMIFSPVKISLVLAIPILLGVMGMMGWIAWKYYGTRAGRQAIISISLFASALIGIPLILFFSNPDPTLQSVYRLTGIEPGKHDVVFIQTMFLLLVFGSLFGLIGYWLKLRNSTWQKTWNVFSGVVMVLVLLVSFYLLSKANNPRIIYTYFGDTGFLESEAGPILSDSMVRKLGISPAQRKEADLIFQKYYKEFLTLERRHTRHTRDEHGHVQITIEPFPDESLSLVKRLHEELSGVIDSRTAPPLPERGKVHTSLGLFRHAGEATVKAELWREKLAGLKGDEYQMKESIKWIDGSIQGGRGYSGNSPQAFPAEYRLFWNEAESNAASNTTVTKAIVSSYKSLVLTTSSPGREERAYRFRAPPGHGVTAWLEVWEDGKLTIPAELSMCLIPQQDAPLDASLRFAIQEGKVISPENEGKLRIDWALAQGVAEYNNALHGSGSQWIESSLAKPAPPNATTMSMGFAGNADTEGNVMLKPEYGYSLKLYNWYRYKPNDETKGGNTTENLMQGSPVAAIILRARIDTYEELSRLYPNRAAHGNRFPGAITAEDRLFTPELIRFSQLAQQLGTLDLSVPVNARDVRRELTWHLDASKEDRAKAITMLKEAGVEILDTAKTEELVHQLEAIVTKKNTTSTPNKDKSNNSKE